MNKIKPKYLTYIRVVPMIMVAVMVLGSYWYLMEHPAADEINVLAVCNLYCDHDGVGSDHW